MDEPRQTTELTSDAELALNQGDAVPKYLWALDDELDGSDDRRAAELGTGLASVGFIRAALRRTAWVWCVTAVLGLVGGIGYYMARPPASEASSTVLLPPATYPGQILDDQVIAESRAVASLAVRSLKLQEPAVAFLKDFTIVAPTDRILIITAKAPTSGAAVREADAMAKAFLAFQGNLLKTQDQMVTASLGNQVSETQHQIASIGAQISHVEAQPSSAVTKAELAKLRKQRAQVAAGLVALKQAVQTNQASMRITTTNTIKRSHVLSEAYPAPLSRLKSRMAFAIIGLILGLVLGGAIVIIRALLSDRLSRRDDVARALAAPVRLSIRIGRLSRRRVRRQGLASAQNPGLSRVVAHLVSSVTPTSKGFASLAVVAVDEVDIAAICLASLALSSARQGLKVVIADLCNGSPAARLLGVTEPGVGEEVIGDARLVVVVPDRDDVLLRGPLSTDAYRPSDDDPLAAACGSADMVLTFATLDPALGGNHLAEWASSVVAVVTAGRSSAQRIFAVGEMIRLAGIRHLSAVLVGADKSDDSLGLTPMGVVNDRPGSHSYTGT